MSWKSRIIYPGFMSSEDCLHYGVPVEEGEKSVGNLTQRRGKKINLYDRSYLNEVVEVNLLWFRNGRDVDNEIRSVVKNDCLPAKAIKELLGIHDYDLGLPVMYVCDDYDATPLPFYNAVNAFMQSGIEILNLPPIGFFTEEECRKLKMPTQPDEHFVNILKISFTEGAFKGVDRQGVDHFTYAIIPYYDRRNHPLFRLFILANSNYNPRAELEFHGRTSFRKKFI